MIGVWDGPEEARRVGDEIETCQRAARAWTTLRSGPGAAPDPRVRGPFHRDRHAVQIVGGFRFYERAEIRDALAYLRVVTSPGRPAFERIVNVPKRGLGDKAVAKIHQLARATGVPLTTAAARILDTDELTAQARRSLGNLVGDIARWRDMARDLPHAELARQLLDESGYTAMYQAEKSTEAAGRLENLSELVRAMEEYESLGAFLEHVSLVMDNEGGRDDPKVTIMTIHAAKGLEYDTVFLVGWEEGLFPSQRALDEGGTAASRGAPPCLCRDHPRPPAGVIIHAANRRIYGHWNSSIPPLRWRASHRTYRQRDDDVGRREPVAGEWSERGDPFADVARGAGRGPGWQRAAGTGSGFSSTPSRVVESRPARSAWATRDGRRPRGACESFTRSSAMARSRRSKATSSRSTSRARAASG